MKTEMSSGLTYADFGLDFKHFNMANHDKGRRKWGGISQDNSESGIHKGRSMGGRGGGHRNPQALYTPGSGPLKKTGRQNDEYDLEVNTHFQERQQPPSIQDRLKSSHSNSTNQPIKKNPRSFESSTEKLNEVRSNYRFNNEQTKSNQFSKKMNCQSNDQDYEGKTHFQEKQKPPSIQDRLKSPHHSNTYQPLKNHPGTIESPSSLAEKLSEVHLNHRYNNEQAKSNQLERKNKKPEQQLYVPKKVQESLAERDFVNRSPSQNDWDRARERDDWDNQSNRSSQRSETHRNHSVRHQTDNRNIHDHGKRYSGSRRNRGTSENEDHWRPNSPRNFVNRRDVRQGSEPPNSIGTSKNMNDVNRTRDTRSVEPGGYDKFQRKPPSGRRNNMKMPLKIDNLPPRLQKKYREQNGLEHPPSGDHEDSSNSSNYHPILPHSQTMQSLPPPISSFQQNWSNTIPARSRGRGRLRLEDLETQYRPGTPDSAPSSRSHTPSQELMSRSFDRRGSSSTMYTSMESLSKDSMLMPPPSISPAISSGKNSRYNNRRRPTSPQKNQNYPSQKVNNNFYNRNSIEKQNVLSHSPSKNEPFSSLPDMPRRTLDWSEEIDPLEEIKVENDILSRSSSVTSFRDNISVSGHHSSSGDGRSRWPKKKKRRERRHQDRSRDKSKTSRENSRERMNNLHNTANDNFINNQKNNGNRRFEGRRGNIIHQSRESSKDRGFRRNDDSSRNRSDMEENWRTGNRTSICESDEGRRTPLMTNLNPLKSISPVRTGNTNTPGVLVLPEASTSPSASRHETRIPAGQRKTLYDPNNPNKPIIVPSPGSRAAMNDGITQNSPITGGHHPPSHFQLSLQLDGAPAPYVADQIVNIRPAWYDTCSESLRSAKNPCLLLGVETMDRELQWLLSSGGLTANWDRVAFLRNSLQQTLQNLLETDMKFCQAENVEQHFWKILFYNIIEMLRKILPKQELDGREVCKKIMLKIIDDGTVYFENLLSVLETTYKFKLDVFLSSSSPSKGLGFIGLAVISAQKIFIFLGDLARYKEQANETTNYGKSRQWYLKAQQLNPKNGRPYNQLALLAHYARRKLDAVYYYMRSLMASNPFHSARESLIALFDENRKKYLHYYESTERKRKEEREWKERARMKEKEGANHTGGGLRRETWIHPGGKRMRRTTSTASAGEAKLAQSDLEELAGLSSVEVNKRFVTSYLHVHGKLITKIGMETFQEAGIQMLREFRVLLQHSPLPLPGTRLLQLLALNMFAIETTQLKDSQMEQGYRSEVQERALVVSLQMFNLILERGVALLKEQLENQERPRMVVDEDMQVLLPAIKIWCDWMLCHSAVWNPPPSCTDYRVGPPGEAWSRLAMMVNLLERLPHPRKVLIQSRETVGRENELDLVRLPEDTTLSGFTPLMSNPQEPFFCLKADDIEVAQICLRIHKILFFGQVFLCGLETPVLKLQKSETGINEYVSLVETSSTSSPSSPPDHSDSELFVDSYSEDEDDAVSKRSSADDPNDLTSAPEIRSLIERKEELERRQRKHERHRQRVQTILQKSSVSVEIEVRPRQLVPDTNCFIDYLSQLQIITRATSGAQPLFTLMVPLVVLNELEGLARGADPKDCPPASRATLNPDHVVRVAEAAKAALAFSRSRNPAIRCLTTKGTVLTSSTFTVEEDVTQDGLISNDDKILATCISLCKSSNKDQITTEEGQPRHLRREVVLLTDDRNLRVKALARDVPVREVPDFMQWAGLG